MVTWTVDVDGGDFGGRTSGDKGILHGLPIILDIFTRYKIKAIFFVSTELLNGYRSKIKRIVNEGHEIGSHGHFHIIYKEKFRKEADRQLSLKLLTPYKSISQESIRYRAPKFNHQVLGEQYSYRDSHVSLLKYMWFKEKIKETVYLHPFDIVETNERAPNLFCKLWYSRPKNAYETFLNLARRYPGDMRLGQSSS